MGRERQTKMSRQATVPLDRILFIFIRINPKVSERTPIMIFL